MKLHSFLSIACLMFLINSACVYADSASQETHYMYNLDDSATIILALIQGDSLTTLLENADPAQVELLLKNFSPAELAWAAEVSNASVPVVVFFHQKEPFITDPLISSLESLSITFKDRLKFIVVDSNSLFKLTEQTGITQLPTLLLIHKQDLLDQIEGTIDHASLERYLTDWLNTLSTIEHIEHQTQTV
jgi:thioredoxin-like negative regulator of GroEL